MTSSRPLVQIVRFGFVGGFVTALHVAVALFVNAAGGVEPLRANIIAFMVACAVSYALNWWWTFDASSHHAAALPKFMTVSLSGFAVNQAIVFGVVSVAGQPLWVAMVPVVFVIPAISFWLNKTWVFLAGRQAA